MAMFNFDFTEQEQQKAALAAQQAEQKKLRSKLTYKDGKLSADIYADEIENLPPQFAPFLNSAAVNVSESQQLEGDMMKMRREEMMKQYEKASQASMYGSQVGAIANSYQSPASAFGVVAQGLGNLFSFKI